MDFSKEYAATAVRAKFEDLPSQAVDQAKRFILDTLGVGIAGSVTPEAEKIVSVVRNWGGKPDSTLLVFGDKLPSIHAALANSVLFHALDFDDTHDGAVIHGYVTNLSAALAVAEKMGGVTGKDLVLALNLGLDLTYRLGLAVGSAPEFTKREVHFVRTAVCGAFGASLVASKLRGLSADATNNALGIVLSQIGGTRQVVVDSAMTKRYQPAFMTYAGLLSAELSAAGVSGCQDVFEGKYGYFNIYWNGAYQREELTRDLGRHFEGVNTSFKPYPCCRYTHGAIDATLDILQKHKLSPSSVNRVDVHVTKQSFFDAVSRPLVLTDNPTMDGQFSIPYTVASAILDGYVFLDSFDPATVRNEKRTELAKKVTVIRDLPVVDRKSLGPVRVEIYTADGCRSTEVRQFKGSPEQPLSWEGCIVKFKRCCRHAHSRISEDKQDKLIDIISRIEEVPDVKTIMDCLV
ncbi:MAG: MmgE/PrpD family protein [Pseudomonadota bacterium]